MKYKSSKQRDMIMNYLQQIHGHVSAEEIFKNMNNDGQKISLATVYRNLNILCEMNEIKKIAHPVDGYQYDKTSRPHYHMHCVKCDSIIDLEVPYMEELNQMLEKDSDVKILSHNIMAEGICKDCLKKES